MRNTVNIFDWYIYKNGEYTMIPFFFRLASGLLILIVFSSLIAINIKLSFISLMITIPTFLIINLLIYLYFNKNCLREYGEINKSFKVKDKYYSFWYIELNEDNEVFKEAFNNFKNEHEWIIEEENIKNLSEILSQKFFIKDTKIVETVAREKRKHWKNNIDTNRLITYREFLKYRKNKKKFEESKKLEKEIKEFQDYYNLNTKGEIKK
ncbi:hypothetical protein UFVDC4_00204 [Staphylococcus phage vB_SauM-UFV_DC4]|nr:hypothetical protein UFVDC4_00204 [Staphylococcus phage vB_SauM-UFV_DC4]